MKKHWTQKYDEGFLGHEPDSTLIEAALKDALGPGSVLELGAVERTLSPCQYPVGREFVAVLGHGQSTEKGFAAIARHNARWVGRHLFFTTAPA